MDILRILYFIMIGFMIFRMIKNGGCCGHSHGVHQAHKEYLEDSTIGHKPSNSPHLTKEEKNNAIDL